MAFVNVEGEVSRLHNSGGGFGLRESWEVQGQERSRFWAVFPKEAVQVQIGDRVKVSGGLQTKVTEPKQDGRVFVDHTVGQAKVEVQGSQAAQGGGFPAPAGQPARQPGFGAQEAFGGEPF